MLKAIIRETLKAALPSATQPVLVASMGRSGSTLVYNSVIDGMTALRFGNRPARLIGLVRDTAWKLSETRFRNGRVYKTHDFAEGLAENAGVRTVFLFGSASSAARSVVHCDEAYGRVWINEHFQHLSAVGYFEDLPEKDILRFEEQIDSWLSCEAVPVLALRYEELWNSDAGSLLSRFVGFPVHLPPRKERKSAGRDLGAIDAQIRQTYAALDKRIDGLPSVLMNRKAQELLQSQSYPVPTRS